MSSEICELTETFFVGGESCVFTFDGLTLQWRDKSVSVSDFVTVDFVHSGNCCSQKRNRFLFGKIPHKCQGHNTMVVRYAEPLKKNKLRLKSVKIRGEGKELTQWFRFLRCSFDRAEKERPKEYLVFINPFSGHQNGVDIYMSKVKPLFEKANKGTTIVITKSREDFEKVINCGTDCYDAILAVGGDGTVSEIVNSLIISRMETLLPGTEEEEVVVPKIDIPIGIIPCGSTDCIAYTLNGTRDAETNALHAILGNRMHFDVCRAISQSGISRFFISVFTYGYLTDLVKESEKFRWMGPMRYNYSGLLALLRFKGYFGQVDLKGSKIRVGKSSLMNIHKKGGGISFAPQKLYENANFVLSDIPEEAKEEPLMDDSPCSLAESISKDKDVCSEKESEKANESNQDEAINGDAIIIHKEDCCCCCCCCCEMEEKPSTSEDTSKNNRNTPKDKEWDENVSNDTVQDIRKEDESEIIEEPSRSVIPMNSVMNFSRKKPPIQEFTISGRYFLIACANISCASELTPNGIAPNCSPGDGEMNVILFQPSSICDMYKMYSRLTSRDRKYLFTELPFISIFETKRVRIRVTQNEVEEKICGNCDGELFHDSVVDIKVYENVIQFYTRKQNRTR